MRKNNGMVEFHHYYNFICCNLNRLLCAYLFLLTICGSRHFC